MNYQDVQRPDAGAFIVVAILIGGILSAMGGGDLVNGITGCILIGGGAWSMWKVGRWMWWRFATQRVESAFR